MVSRDSQNSDRIISVGCPMFQAYAITCKPSGKTYIGITGASLSRRWTEHQYSARRRPNASALYSAIAKYGIDSFTIQPLCSATTWADICAVESLLIQQHGTLAPIGYNLTLGGEGRSGFRPSVESVERSASKHRGLIRSMDARAKSAEYQRGRKKSDSHRAAIAAAKRGTTRSVKTREKISTSSAGISRNAGDKNPAAKLTEAQVREARQRLATGESQRSIARSFNIHYNAIWKIANGVKWKLTV